MGGGYEYVFTYRTWTPSVTSRETESSIYLDFREPTVTVKSISLPVSGLVWEGSGTAEHPFVVNDTEDDLWAGTYGPRFSLDILMEVDDPLDFTEGGTHFIFHPVSNVPIQYGQSPDIKIVSGSPSMAQYKLANLAAGGYEYVFKYLRGSSSVWHDSGSRIYLRLGGPYDADEEAEDDGPKIKKDGKLGKPRKKGKDTQKFGKSKRDSPRDRT